MKRFAYTLALLFVFALAAHAETLILEQPQTAGMSGFRAHWDMPFVLTENAPLRISDKVVTDRGGAAVWKDSAGALAFDALNRSLLVRFPDAAEKIAEYLKKGYVITKVELVLPFRDEELWPMGGVDYFGPEGYNYRANWGTDKLYQGIRPHWHAVAWALRRPWTADATLGPTFNAAVNGAVYWTKFGAQDTQRDRFPQRFGPAEVSYKQPEGRLDITPLLNDIAFGQTLSARLRTLADCGLLVQKEETYDHIYYTGAYEWSTATGGRAILVKAPQLAVTLDLPAGGAKFAAPLPPTADIPALAAKAKEAKDGGQPTAFVPTPEQLQAMAQKYAQKPAWMSDWQWQHVRELVALENPEKAEEPFWYQFVPPHIVDRLTKYHWDKGKKIIDKAADPSQVYGAWVDGLVGRQPRGWSGFESAREMAQWYLYKDAMPSPAQDAIRRYWTAWLMPDRATAPAAKRRYRFDVTGMLVHPMCDDPRVGGADAKWPDPLNGRFDTYYMKTGDWRGNKSFFRSGFTYDMSTQNFNTTASAGAMLAGALINSDLAMADGRHGVENFPLRMYCWSDGSGQEHIDHYYYAITLAGNKAVADFSGTPYDRLLGQSLLTKNVEELVSAYHPGLRSFVAGSSRTSLDLVLGEQDGLQTIMHTLSKSGALKDVGSKTLPGNIATWGHDLPPLQVAQQTLPGPWAPEWVSPMVDDKPLPYEAKHTGWGGVKRTCYLGRNYGIASNAVNPGRIQAMAHWRHEAKQVTGIRDLGTMDLRYSANTTRWTNDGQGSLSQPGTHVFLQQRNKLIAIMSPKNTPGGAITSLQSSIGLFNCQEPAPAWEIYVDGVKVEQLPFTCKQGQRITIKDGVTYLGIIPLPATDLGRDAEVTLEAGPPQKADFYQSNVAAALVINSYNYKSPTPLATAAKELGTAVGKAYGGFVIEFADKEDYADFADFQKHMAATKLDVAYDAPTSTARVTYVSGKDTLEAAGVTFDPQDPQNPVKEKEQPSLVTALVNGASPFLPKGLERDTPYCQQGLGRVEKNGATLEADPGRRIFLLTEPKAGVYCGWNPLPDLTTLKLTTPGNITVTADGKLSLTRIVVRPATQTIDIDQAFKPGQESEAGAATALLIYSPKPPKVTLNGKVVAKLGQRTVDGKTAYVVPLREVK
ncbi:MAG: hypothetical protein ACYDBB_22665 [Armatimonadota bacterium]